jgi:hypothetical protein
LRGSVREAPFERLRSRGAARSLLTANLCGHGVGRQIHESPSVPSVEVTRDRRVLWEGLVLASPATYATYATGAIVDVSGGRCATSSFAASHQPASAAAPSSTTHTAVLRSSAGVASRPNGRT